MKSNQIIQMFSAADTDAAASIDIPDDGNLLAVFWSLITGGAAADADRTQAQLSFGSTSAFVSNDARQSISNIGIGYDLAGVAANIFRTEITRDVYFGDPGIEVFAGERIFLHVVDNGNSVNLSCLVDLLFNFKGGPTRRR